MAASATDVSEAVVGDDDPCSGLAATFRRWRRRLLLA